MKNFKYCIWFLPENSSIFYRYTNGFLPHMTIKSNMSFSYAKILYDKIQPINLDLEFKTIQTSVEDDFCALYAGIKKKDIWWWPKNAHISFQYRYNNPYTKQDMIQLQNKLIGKTRFKCNQILLVRCDSYFTTWKNKILFSKTI